MIEQVVSVLDNALLQGLGYGIAVVGVTISFRIVRWPDLTADGSFLTGGVVLGACLISGWPWLLAALAASCAGAAAGLMTAMLHSQAGVNRLLTGILTSMMCYSAAFWILSGRPNINLAGRWTLFSAAELLDDWPLLSGIGLHAGTVVVSLLVAGTTIILVWCLLKSDFGVVLRAIGENEALVESLGRKPPRYHAIGLMVANALIALSGALVSSRQGFADVNMGSGVIITLVAALVIGEETIRVLHRDAARSLAGRAMSGVVGAFVYFLLYLGILRASILGWLPVRIQPTDLKFMSAVIVVVFVLIRRRTQPKAVDREEILPI